MLFFSKDFVNFIILKISFFFSDFFFLRITLSLKCLNKSKSIYLWAPGISKSFIIKKILSDKKFKYPASFLKQKNNFLFHSN